MTFPDDPTYHILDFPHSFVELHHFVNCFKPQGLMHNLVLDLKCSLLNKSWHDKGILPQATVVSLVRSIVALQCDISLNFHFIYFVSF